MGRWLGIDHGAKRVGIAVGNTADGIASPLAMVPAEPRRQLLVRIRELARDFAVEGLVVGWPLNMDDTEGPQAKIARELAARLAEATGMDVRLWDERLSSFAADEALAGSYTRKQKRARQDAVAAAVMLHDFLAGDGPQKAGKP